MGGACYKQLLLTHYYYYYYYSYRLQQHIVQWLLRYQLKKVLQSISLNPPPVNPPPRLWLGCNN